MMNRTQTAKTAAAVRGIAKTGETTRRLTQVELELMTVLWRLGSGTVGEVLEELPADRRLAYTSVSTILRILEKKGVLESRKKGRGHLYVPRVDKTEYEAWSVQDLVARLFDGAPAALVRTLLESETLTPGDRRSIRDLLDKKGAR
jgi:BlaI family transcriptional regulator, penicillinase repressor